MEKCRAVFVKKGKGLNIVNSKSYNSFVDALDEGQEIEGTFIRVEDIRNLAQNRLYWRILTLIANEYGDLDLGPNKWHDYFKSKWLCHPEDMLGEQIYECTSTADLSKKEFSEYLEKIASWAAQKMELVVMNADDRLVLK